MACNMKEINAIFKLLEVPQAGGKPAAKAKAAAWDKDNTPDTWLEAANFCITNGYVHELRHKIKLEIQTGGHKTEPDDDAWTREESFVKLREIQANYVAQSKRKMPIPTIYGPRGEKLGEGSAAQGDDPMGDVQQGPSNNAPAGPSQNPKSSVSPRRSTRGQGRKEDVALEEEEDDDDEDGAPGASNNDDDELKKLRFGKTVQMAPESSAAASANFFPGDGYMIHHQQWVTARELTPHQLAKLNNEIARQRREIARPNSPCDEDPAPGPSTNDDDEEPENPESEEEEAEEDPAPGPSNNNNDAGSEERKPATGAPRRKITRSEFKKMNPPAYVGHRGYH